MDSMISAGPTASLLSASLAVCRINHPLVTEVRRIRVRELCGMKPTNSRLPVAELRGVGQVSDLPVATSLRAQFPATRLSLDVSGESEVHLLPPCPDDYVATG